MTDARRIPPPILVCGAHRSGTTWVGKMLSASGETAYISEPLNVLHRPGVLITPTQYWYTYICEDNEQQFLPGLRQTLSFEYHLMSEVRSLRSIKDLARMGRDWSIFLQGKMRQLRPLLKDPFAVFCSPWFAKRLGCQVVITVRHPAAFVSSLKRLQWPFQLQDLLDQPLLMRDLLEPFRAEMVRLSKNPADTIDQDSLLWKMVYSVVHTFRSEHSEFQVVRHEDLSLEPGRGYRDLYHRLGLEYSTKAQKKILSSSSSENPNELKKNSAHSVHLNSQASLDNWKRRLSLPEISRIREITEETAALYYPDLSWD